LFYSTCFNLASWYSLVIQPL